MTIGALGARGDLIASALGATLIEGGEYIRALTPRRSGAALSELLATARRQAWVARGHHRERVPVDALTVDETVVVSPGELIPVDGRVVRGRATVDQKTLTGEAGPLLKTVGH